MTSNKNGRFCGSRGFALATGLAAVAACSSSSGGAATSTQPDAVTCSAMGGPVPVDGSHPADNHCGSDKKQPTDLSSCHPDAAAAGDDATAAGSDAAGRDDAAGGDDGAVAGPGDGGATGNCDPTTYGASMYGTTGSDDDCKYDVSWSSTPLCEGGNGVYFTVSAKKRENGSNLTGAEPYIEAVQACLHPAPNPTLPAKTSTEETAPGVYKIGPILFDRPGIWIVRFHFYGGCEDALRTSPHGHAAFFVNVP